MILIIGPMFSGKTDYALTLAARDEILFDAETLAADCGDLTALADSIFARYRVVTASEIGGGIVPIDPDQRKYREAAWRLCRLLAERSDTVIRVFCGIPTTIKGGLK